MILGSKPVYSIGRRATVWLPPFALGCPCAKVNAPFLEAQRDERHHRKDPGSHNPGSFRTPRVSLEVPYSSFSESSRRRRAPAHKSPVPPVARNSAIAPSGTTFSTPVNAVPPGVTVVGET